MRKFETVDEVKSVTAHEVINTIKSMVIISGYEVEYNGEENIFNNQ